MAVPPQQFGKIEVPYHKILARLGYAQGKTALDERTVALINDEIELSKKLIAVRQVVARSAVIVLAPGKLALEPGLIIESKQISELLSGCAAAYGFAVTIGPHLEGKRDRYLDQRETARALILDAIGSTAAEEIADITHRQIGEEAAKEGFEVTRRFSPGYGDWPLAAQKDFLTWTGADRIGIRLTGKFQMVPEKSVSAILGIRKKG